MKPPLHRAFLSLGSNIDPEQNLVSAVRILGEYGRVSRVSTVWETSPLGQADQPNFLNAAVLLRTAYTARKIVEELIPRVERELGRVRDPEHPNGPRTIDVDLALFDEDILMIGTHHVPDPDILERSFLALTLSELSPIYIHPVTGQRLAAIAADLIARGWSGALIRRDDVQLK